MHSGRLPEAVAQYEEALRLKPDYPLARTNFGNVLVQSGKPPEAIDQYQQALRSEPRRADAWIGLASAYSQLNRSEDAAAAAQEALDLARSQGQTVLVQRIEEWITAHAAKQKQN